MSDGREPTKKIVVFAGTRPEIIKMAPVVRALKAGEGAQSTMPGAFQTVFCYSGQHLELAQPFLDYFDLKPDAQLNLMSQGQSLGQLTSRACAQMDEFFANTPGICAALVQGDTTTAFAAALTAFYHKVPVGHVEAGLRTSDISEPFPEELNRRLITRVGAWHYAPTVGSRQALLDERVPENTILVTGNTGIDSFLWAVAQKRPTSLPALKGLEGRRLVLITAHRRENIGAPLEEITGALAELARRHPDISFVFPVHKNPKVRDTVMKNLGGIANLNLIDPLDYGDLVWTMSRAELILSDSGGIQEEAPSLRKPVLVLRNETERPEAVAYGTSIMVGHDRNRILSEAEGLLSGKRKLRLPESPNPYGDGRAAERLVQHLLTELRFLR